MKVEAKMAKQRTEKIKNILKFLGQEFIYGGHLISFGAASIVVSGAIILGIQLSWPPVVVAYLMTFTALLYNRHQEQDIDFLTNPQRTNWLKKHFHFLFVIIFVFVITSAVILIFYKKIVALIFIFFLFLLSFLYTKYLKALTKKIALLKNIVFSLITSLLVIFLILYCSYPLLTMPVFLFWVFVFLRMLVNTIFLDIKDIKGDSKAALLTLPVLWGEKKTLFFLKALTMFSVLPIILGCWWKKLPNYSLMLLLIVPHSFYYFNKSREQKNFFLVNYVLADAEFILWLSFLLLGKILI